jgi:beta-glucosidase
VDQPAETTSSTTTDEQLSSRAGDVPRLLARHRFSLEWSRIEPAEGEFSLAARDHYPRMVDACLAADITPNVTLNHFTIPRWLDVQGGWRSPVAVDRFARCTEFIRPVVERDVRVRQHPQ